MRKCAILAVLLILIGSACENQNEYEANPLYGLLDCDNGSYSEFYLADSAYSFSIDIDYHPKEYEIDEEGRLIVSGDTSILRLINGVWISTDDSVQVFQIDPDDISKYDIGCPKCDHLFIRTLFHRKNYCSPD